MVFVNHNGALNWAPRVLRTAEAPDAPKLRPSEHTRSSPGNNRNVSTATVPSFLSPPAESGHRTAPCQCYRQHDCTSKPPSNRHFRPAADTHTGPGCKPRRPAPYAGLRRAHIDSFGTPTTAELPRPLPYRTNGSLRGSVQTQIALRDRRPVNLSARLAEFVAPDAPAPRRRLAA